MAAQIASAAPYRAAQRIMSPPRCGFEGPAQTLLRLPLHMRYERVFPAAMPAELQITPFCAPQRMDAEIPDAAHSGGSMCGF